MAVFSTKKILYGSTSLIPVIANRINDEFVNDGYKVRIDSLSSGGCDISITKGGIFKAVLGMKTALKVTLLPQGDNIINFEAGVGIWGQQAIPTVISMLFLWPVLLTQIWGLVEQSGLDDKALNIAQSVIAMSGYCNIGVNQDKGKFCTACGTQNSASAKFCCGCRKQL
ncbi:MAG: zinc ribbon domain-containing protein [Bacteroidaceae bacterium]|nr:zinc ribbon domain-containing protein [Bacteroidaceae bacterium]